jgi:DNA-binding NarL/FixJ family response regulator
VAPVCAAPEVDGTIELVRRISVLVVDDHRVFADALHARLSIEEVIGPVAVAYSAADALARLLRNSFDVTLLDYGLDDRSGADLAAELRTAVPSTRIIILSGGQPLDAVIDSLIAGVNGWVPKMIDTSFLVDAICGVHAGEMWVDRALLGQAMPALLARILTPPPDPLAVLTKREREVPDCMIGGLSRGETAKRLNVSDNTVRTHTQNLIGKLGVHSSLEVVTLALRSGHRPA